MKMVNIVEVSPRDGIQNESRILTTDEKLQLITKAADAGIRRIEVTSFVNPQRVPQMADSAELIARLPANRSYSAIGLVLNEKGFDRALAAGVDEVNFVVVASETFSQKNQGCSTFDGIATWQRIAARADLATSVTIGAAFGCPFEGEIPLERLMTVVDGVMMSRPTELALADTIGVAGPFEVKRRIRAIRDAYPDVALRCHFHNTRNTGYANAIAAVEEGVETLDSSIGGVGGCPFAPRATGNIATEDLVYLLDRCDIRTGTRLDEVISAATWLEGILGKVLPGQLMKAGGFPPTSA